MYDRVRLHSGGSMGEFAREKEGYKKYIPRPFALARGISSSESEDILKKGNGDSRGREALSGVKRG